MNSKIKVKIILLCSAAFMLFNLIYLINFNGEFSKTSQEYSNYGSFIGGSLTPLLSIITIYMLVMTFESQNKQFDTQIENQRNQFELQLLATSKEYKRAQLYSQIDSLINRIDIAKEFPIDPRDLFDFLHKNEKIAKYLCKKSNKDYSEFEKETVEEFYRKNKDKHEFNVISFVNLLCESKSAYGSFKVPQNIDYKVEKLPVKLNHLAFLIANVNEDFDISHTYLKVILGDIFPVNKLLYEAGIYQTADQKSLYQVYKSLEDDEYSHSIIIDKSKFIEVQKDIYVALLNENKIDRSVEFERFMLNYKLESTQYSINVFDKQSNLIYTYNPSKG